MWKKDQYILDRIFLDAAAIRFAGYQLVRLYFRLHYKAADDLFLFNVQVRLQQQKVKLTIDTTNLT